MIPSIGYLRAHLKRAYNQRFNFIVRGGYTRMWGNVDSVVANGIFCNVMKKPRTPDVWGRGTDIEICLCFRDVIFMVDGQLPTIKVSLSFQF